MQTDNFKNIIDTHFHSLSVKEYGPDIVRAIVSLKGGIDIGTCADDLPERYEFLKNYPHIKLAAAMGPWETENRTVAELDSQFEILKSNIDKYNPLFIGEAGLDNHHDNYGSKEVQEYLFEKHLVLAEKLNKKIIIHNREANDRVLNLIKNHSATGIIHCFSADLNFMKEAVDCGYYISFAGNVTYKANKYMREILKEVPSDRLLLETDAPYLTPGKLRGNPNTPEYIIYTYEYVAEVLEISLEQLTQKICENFNNLCS